MTRPECSYAGCREPVYRCVSWAGGQAFCRQHWAVFQGSPAVVPEESRGGTEGPAIGHNQPCGNTVKGQGD